MKTSYFQKIIHTLAGKRFLQQPQVLKFSKTFLFEEEPQKSLNYLFSPAMIAIIANSIWILGICLLVFWPQKEISEYLLKMDIPLNFLVVFEILLLGHGYFNLVSGGGDLMADDGPYYLQRATITYEESRPFLSYALLKFLVQIPLMFLPFFPFIWIAAMLSQVSWSGVFKCLLVIFSFSLFCRLLGFAAYLKWRKKLRGHYLTRSFLLIFLISTFYFLPSLNPLLILYDLYEQANDLVTTSLNSYTVYLSFMVVMIATLITVNHRLVQRQLTKGG